MNEAACRRIERQATALRIGNIHVKGDPDIAEILDAQHCREDIFCFLIQYQYLPKRRA